MERESRKCLEDIRQAAELIDTLTGGKTLSQYGSDIPLHSAVECQFRIIGEALHQLSRTDPATASRITDQERVMAMRDALADGYEIVDAEVVWDVARSSLPALHRAVRDLLTG